MYHEKGLAEDEKGLAEEGIEEGSLSKGSLGNSRV